MNFPVSGRESRPDRSCTELCSQPEPEQSGVGYVEGDSSAVATHIQPCTQNCSFSLLPGLWARKQTWLNAGSHLTDSCTPVLTAGRALKLRCESHGQSICRWMPGRRLEQQSPALSLLAPGRAPLAGMEVSGPTGRAACRKPGLGAPPRGVTAGLGTPRPDSLRQKLLYFTPSGATRLCLHSSE